MRETYKSIPGTMCDFHSYYDWVADKMPDGCRVIEVGAADGHSAIYLAEALANRKKKFQLVIVENMDYGRYDQQNTLLNNIMRSGLAEHIRLEVMDSLNASCKFPDNWAHHIFIDASHKYEETKADIRLWHHKVMHGFYLAGHDYNDKEGIGVWNAVNEVIPGATILFTDNDLGVWRIKKGEVIPC